MLAIERKVVECPIPYGVEIRLEPGDMLIIEQHDGVRGVLSIASFTIEKQVTRNSETV